jgi:phage tail protein X
MLTVYAEQNDTVDQICNRYVGKTAGIVEAVYAANPRLAEKGVFLPEGTKIFIPDFNQPTKTTVNLWD